MSSIDYEAALAGDTTYRDALTAIEQARAADEAQRNATVYQGTIRYGGLPPVTDATSEAVRNFLAGIPQYVQDAATLATQGGFSTLGQLAHTYALNQSLMRGNLGERGIIRSGDYAYLTNKNAYTRQLGEANAQDVWQQGFLEAQKNYLALLDQLRGERTSAAQAAWQRMIDRINASGGAAAAGSLANPNDPGLVPNRLLPTPTATPGLNIPAVDEQGYAILPESLYPVATDIGGFHQGAMPNTPFVPDWNQPYDPSGELSMEPKTASNTTAYSDVMNQVPQYDQPSYDQPIDTPDYVSYQPSDAGESYRYNYGAPRPAAPTPAIQYNKYSIARNSL